MAGSLAPRGSPELAGIAAVAEGAGAAHLACASLCARSRSRTLARTATMSPHCLQTVPFSSANDCGSSPSKPTLPGVHSGV